MLYLSFKTVLATVCKEMLDCQTTNALTFPPWNNLHVPGLEDLIGYVVAMVITECDAKCNGALKSFLLGTLNSEVL